MERYIIRRYSVTGEMVLLDTVQVAPNSGIVAIFKDLERPGLARFCADALNKLETAETVPIMGTAEEVNHA